MVLAIHEMMSRNLGMVLKTLSIPAIVAWDVFVDEFLKYPGVVKPHTKYMSSLDVFH